MAKTLTILACPLTGEGTKADPNIDEVSKYLRAAQTTDYILEHAAKHADLEEIFKKHPGPHNLIQIIGHGVPGTLWLGGSYDGYARDVGNAYVAVFSHPKMLFRMRGLPQTDALWLIGCSTGAETRSPFDTVYDGWTLLFALARAAKAVVGGPVDAVDPCELASGIFAKPERLTVFDPTGRVRVGQPKPPLPKERTMFRVVRITGGVVLSDLEKAPFVFHAQLEATESDPIVLGAPQLEVELLMDAAEGRLVKGELVADYRALVLPDDPKTGKRGYYALTEDAREGLLRALSATLFTG